MTSRRGRTPSIGERVKRLLAAGAILSVAACGARNAATAPATRGNIPGDRVAAVNAAAEEYVRLVLAVGEHDPDYVDAYFGPESWRTEEKSRKRPLDEIHGKAAVLRDGFSRLRPPETDEPALRRLRALSRQLDSLIARVEMLRGRKFSFDEESRALYDAVAPHFPEEHFRGLAGDLEALLPGTAPLVDRYDAFRNRFNVPREKLDAVFQAAIGACRDRTRAHVELPASESFRLEYVTGKSWGGYNWYQGRFRSLIQVNTDLPVSIDRAVDLACHEGYPGHHVYNLLLEKNLVVDRGWTEYTVYPLFSPRSLIAEGSANFGIEVAFPGNERSEYERRVLFPLAGLDPGDADRFDRVRAILERLSYAGNEAARRYLDGEIDAAGAVRWLSDYALMPRDRAEQRVRFFDQYRSYVINYNLGKDLVRTFVESRGGTPDRPERRWEEFRDLLSSPLLPSDLAPGGVSAPAR